VRLLGITVVALALLAGCTGGSSGDATGGPTSAAPTTAPPSSPSGPAVDCAAVDAARGDLTEAANAELERLGIDRSDQRAFQIQLLVTSQQAAEYWTAVRDAVPESATELRQDADAVVAYWSAIDAELDAITVPDAGEQSVQAAVDQLSKISGAHPDETVVPAQERLTAALDSACGAAIPTSTP
jgi:hypothetical protein